MEPFEHNTQLLDTSHHQPNRNAKSGRYVLASRLLENLRHLIKGQFIPSKRESMILRRLGIHKCRRSKEPNVTRRDQLQGLALQRHLPCSRKHLPEVIWCEVLEKGNGTENRPFHIGLFCILFEMLLDLVFENKMRDWG